MELVNNIFLAILMFLFMLFLYRGIEESASEQNWSFGTVMTGIVVLLGIIVYINIADITWILGG